jgi:hypothetical protein
LIVLQLFKARQSAPPSVRNRYASIISIIVDSSALYAITSIVLLVLCRINSMAMIWWSPMTLGGSMAVCTDI